MKTIDIKITYLLPALTLMLAAGLFLAGCGSEAASSEDKSKKSPLVEVVSASQGEISKDIDITGEIVATREIRIQATVEGPVGFSPWREGDRVKKGEKLIEIDRPLYRSEVKEAEANLAVAESKLADLKAGTRPEEIAQTEQNVEYLQECAAFARKNLERVQELAEKGGVSGEALEKARLSFIECHTNLVSTREKLSKLKTGPTQTELAVQEAEVKKAEAALAKARAKLDETRIYAPFDGTITKVYVHPGDLATPQAPLLEMLDRSSLAVRFSVSERLISDIKPGMKAGIRLDAYSGRDFDAKIVRIYPELNRQSGTVPVEAEMTAPRELMPGMFARVSLSVQTAREAVLIPANALLSTSGDREAVFVVSDGKAEQREIRIGLEQGSRVQVLEGLKPGEKVVVAGMNSITDGTAVHTEEAKISEQKQEQDN
ncbi:MAG: efflux RND transporter periplasmic adaptor subunit [Desulfobacterales bacterium]|nr:efflux RND transporter periplasmic adaptor subunit [Desulfobacterales bacterium]